MYIGQNRDRVKKKRAEQYVYERRDWIEKALVSGIQKKEGS